MLDLSLGKSDHDSRRVRALQPTRIGHSEVRGVSTCVLVTVRNGRRGLRDRWGAITKSKRVRGNGVRRRRGVRII